MINIKFIKKENRAVAYDNEIEIGECKFKELEDTWNIIHTGVDSKYQGQGIAKKLVKCIIENSEKCNKNLIAECSYAKKVLESNNVCNEKNKMNKKILGIVILVIVIVIIVIVGSVLYNNSESIDNDIQQENIMDKYIEDEKNDEITSLIQYLRPKYVEDVKKAEDLKDDTFDTWIEKMRELKDTNLFAQKFIEILDSTNYNELENYEKMFLDNCIRNYFNKYVYLTSMGAPRNIVEAYIVDYNYQLKDNGGNLNIEQLIFKKDGRDVFDRLIAKTNNQSKKCIQYELNFSSSFSENSGIRVGNEIYQVKSVDVSILNNLLVEYKDLIGFMKEYSKEVFVPIAKAEAEKEEAEKEAEEEKKEKENQLKNSIPQVGMTAEVVKKTKWGSPDKINKDTYSWGTSEQWVYNKYGYVYLKNGIVTSVSER